MKGKIFNAQEVEEILNGSKVMFREVINTKQSFIEPNEPYGKCPYKVGQKIFCKETFWQFGRYDGGSDGDKARFIGSNEITFCPEEAAKPQTLCKGWKKRPAQHMKQEHSRLTLLIKEIRVERLASISEEDAIKEGFTGFCNEEGTWYLHAPCRNKPDNYSTKNVFKRAWNETHKEPEEKFEANPWVWCVTIEVVK